MLKKLPIPFVYVLFTGVLLGMVIGFKSVIPFLYFGELDQFEWERSVLPHIINYLFWPFLVPLIYWTFSSFSLGKNGSYLEKSKTIGMSLLVPFIHEITTTAIYFSTLNWLGVYYLNEESLGMVKAAFPSVYIGRIVEFWIIYGLFAAFDFYKKYKDKQSELSKMEAQLHRSQLSVLKMQLQPHFLFNALNSISSLMNVDIKKAQLVTARLGDLLRGILEQDQRLMITVEEELEYVRTYLEIEQIRFEDRLHVIYAVDEHCLGKSIPPLLIQPLVENAVKHAVAPLTRQVDLHVKLSLLNNDLQVEVSDNGAGSSLGEKELFEKGIGLSNLRERLHQLYSDTHNLKVESNQGEGFGVFMTIPLKMS